MQDELAVNSWEYRNNHIKEELIRWYETLHKSIDHEPSERLEAQLQMLIAVLYLLLTPKEYKKLTTIKEDLNNLTLV